MKNFLAVTGLLVALTAAHGQANPTQPDASQTAPSRSAPAAPSAGAADASRVDPNRIVASVNGEEIKGDEYYYRMEFLPNVGKRTGNVISEFPPGFLTLEQLITERLVFQLAKQQDVYPSDLAVQDELANRIRKDPNLVANWVAGGRRMDELKYQVRYDLAQFNLATFGVTITDLEVDNYYKKNPDLFTVPKQFKLSVIVVSTADDKAAVDKDLAAGKPFADVARARSVDATKSVGGDYGTVPITILGASTKTAIEATKIGETTSWIESATGATVTAYIKFKIEDITPEKLLPLTDDLRRSIRTKRMLEMGAVRNDVEKQMVQMRRKANIDIKQKVFADAYSKYIEAYLKEKGN